MLSLFQKSGIHKIVIIGCGRLGASLANSLYEQGRQVIIIDKNEDAFRKLNSSFGGLTLVGDATNLDVFKQLEVDKNTIFIVVTNNDNINIMVSQMARELYCLDNIICRLYDPQRECVYDEFHINTICPTYLSVHEIQSILNQKGV
ncbi:potassium channel family protein [Thomasclavelia saccharogumia]|uniref:potassium channel family protein n=1 Tax=Thomasclavelia saccharogumia TaxID=341225 RepID=UPI0006916238|nr:TrkA family potassium uptake protein [Thomasclavelia saccharogumia]